MAYAPYQPWDKTYSYSEGETCTYEGLPYVFWLYGPTISKSNVGIPPNEEMRLFSAVSPDGLTESRMERSWVVGEVFIAGELNNISARYGNIRTLQPTIRGNDASTNTISSPYNGALYNGIMYGGNRFFPDPLLDPLPPEEQPEVTWDFYRTGFAMSVDYRQDGSNNGNIYVGNIEDGTTGKISMPTSLSTGASPYLVSINVPPVGPPPDPPVNTFDVIFKIPYQIGISTFNCFNRVANFRIVNSSGDTIGSGSVSSGPVRENWLDNDTYPKVRFTFPSGYYTALVLDSITPRFDQ
jgi:hypothetical protein